MDRFDIRFIADSVTTPKDCAFGRICVGSFEETFVSSIGYWSKRQYEAQWLAATTRVLQSDRAALITSITSPGSSNFVRWWAMYREFDVIHIQQQICFLEELTETFDPYRVERFVAERRVISEEGMEISEWDTSASVIRSYVERNG